LFFKTICFYCKKKYAFFMVGKFSSGFGEVSSGFDEASSGFGEASSGFGECY
jgi:hypothetical protein